MNSFDYWYEWLQAPKVEDEVNKKKDVSSTEEDICSASKYPRDKIDKVERKIMNKKYFNVLAQKYSTMK